MRSGNPVIKVPRMLRREGLLLGSILVLGCAPLDGDGDGEGPSLIEAPAVCGAPAELRLTSEFLEIERLEDFDDVAAGDCQPDGNGADVVFLFESERAGLLTVEAYGEEANVDLYLRGSCAEASSETFCSAAAGPGHPESLTASVGAGQVVYVFLSGATASAVGRAFVRAGLEPTTELPEAND